MVLLIQSIQILRRVRDSGFQVSTNASTNASTNEIVGYEIGDVRIAESSENFDSGGDWD